LGWCVIETRRLLDSRSAFISAIHPFIARVWCRLHPANPSTFRFLSFADYFSAKQAGREVCRDLHSIIHILSTLKQRQNQERRNAGTLLDARSASRQYVSSSSGVRAIFALSASVDRHSIVGDCQRPRETRKGVPGALQQLSPTKSRIASRPLPLRPLFHRLLRSLIHALNRRRWYVTTRSLIYRPAEHKFRLSFGKY